MNINHFNKTNNDGMPYQFQYDDTYLVIAKLYKLENWGPFEKIGELTSEGVCFVEQNIEELSPETWEEYLSRTN